MESTGTEITGYKLNLDPLGFEYQILSHICYSLVNREIDGEWRDRPESELNRIFGDFLCGKGLEGLVTKIPCAAPRRRMKSSVSSKITCFLEKIAVVWTYLVQAKLWYDAHPLHCGLSEIRPFGDIVYNWLPLIDKYSLEYLKLVVHSDLDPATSMKNNPLDEIREWRVYAFEQRIHSPSLFLEIVKRHPSIDLTDVAECK